MAGVVKRFWKSPGFRRLRHRISGQQHHLFPVVLFFIRVWLWVVSKRVAYERKGPIFDYFRVDAPKPCIVALWHQDTFPLLFELSRYTHAFESDFMVSHGRVGTSGRYLLAHWNVSCVVGSGPKRGVAAVKELSRRVQETQKTAFIMADGSRGPERRARWGAIYLARDTGLPIIPVRAWAENLWILKNTWMRLALPKPWGRAVVLSGEPLYVPSDTLEREALDGYRLELEKRLNDLVAQADARFPNMPSGPEQT